MKSVHVCVQLYILCTYSIHFLDLNLQLGVLVFGFQHDAVASSLQRWFRPQKLYWYSSRLSWLR